MNYKNVNVAIGSHPMKKRLIEIYHDTEMIFENDHVIVIYKNVDIEMTNNFIVISNANIPDYNDCSMCTFDSISQAKKYFDSKDIVQNNDGKYTVKGDIKRVFEGCIYYPHDSVVIIDLVKTKSLELE
jgi:hypothetical protein